VPVKSRGSILVIARVVWSGGVEERRAARAIRWTTAHVMVAGKDDDNDPRSERHEWLCAGGVCRTGELVRATGTSTGAIAKLRRSGR